MKKLKYIFLSLLFLGVANPSNAQFYVYSESFENTGPNCGDQAFLQNCFPTWINTHGSAALKSSSLFNPSFDGSKHVKMYVDKRVECSEPDRGEGVAMLYLFEPGQCYRLSYAIRGRAGEVAWILTNGLPSNGDTDVTCSGNDVVPAIPAGSTIITGTNTSLNTKPWTHIQNIEFTPTSQYIQLWFRASNLSVSNPSHYQTNVFLDLVEIEECCYDCEINKDLTACPGEGDFGFVGIDCPGEYEWDIPTGSTAVEVTSEDQSLLVNASPGSYAVTITDAAGCVTESEFEVLEVCCDSVVNECVPPTNLTCLTNHGQISGLDWDPVPGAQGYVLTIIPNDGDCGCRNAEGPPFGILVDEPPYVFNFSFIFDCYGWNVRTICEDGTQSEPSETACVDRNDCSSRGK